MFKDFLLDYRIERNKIYNSISIKQLPKYRIIFLILITIFGMLGIFFSFNSNNFALIFNFIIFLVLCLILYLIDQRPKNQKKLRENYFSHINQKKLTILKELLIKYNIDTDDKINFIINRAREDYDRASKKFFSAFFCSVISALMASILQPFKNIYYFLLILLFLIYIYLMHLLYDSIFDLYTTNLSLCEDIIQGLEYIRAFNKK